MSECRRFTRTLPVRLSDTELLERGDALAAVTQDIEREEATQADVRASMKATMTSLQARRAALASVISRKSEMREVYVDEVHDYRDGTYSLIRSDTGEVIEHRPLTEAEREQPLPLQ